MSGLRQAPDRDAANAAPSNRPPTHMTIENQTEAPGTQPGLQYKHRPAPTPERQCCWAPSAVTESRRYEGAMTVMRSLRYRHLISIPLLALATTAGAQSSDDSLVGLATRAAARLAVIQLPGRGPRTELTLEDALARALERRRDIAVRLALGASRASLIRRLLTETMVLSLLAGAVGIGIALWLLDLLGNQMAECDVFLLQLGVAGKVDDLHAVLQGGRNVLSHVGRAEEEDVGEVELHLKVVIHEGVILLRIQNL